MDVVASFCVGWSETLVGYPFVTAKVLLQNGKSWRQPFLHYYRGVKYPLMSSVGFNMLVFPVHARLYKEWGHVGAGALAGLLVSAPVYFVDTFTIRRQTNQSVSLSMFRGSRGLGMTFSRETLAMGTYFGTYYKLREGSNSFVAGGCAGLANWTLTFPLDTLRTRQIAQRCNIREALKQSRLWRGFGFAATRSVVVNAVSFSVYEKVLSYIKGKNISK